MLFGDVDSALVAAEAARRTALFALAGTGLTALVTIAVAVLTQRNNKALAKLNANLASSKSEEDARRDYDYDARKRLYKECEPVLFQLAEAAENALHRVFSLARTARDGNLPDWLESPDYYMASTIYNLLSPMVKLRLLQQRMTLVDLSVDSRIHELYLIAKWLSVTFTDDFTLAEVEPRMAYQPFIPDWEKNRAASPERHWRQGVPLGRLDVAIESMIEQTADGSSHCLTYGKFEKAFREDLNDRGTTFGIFADIFWGFHPQRRPVLWRILVVQAHLNAALMRAFAQQGKTGFAFSVPTSFMGADWVKLDWREPQQELSEELVRAPVLAAMSYIQKRLPTLRQEQSPPITAGGDS